MLAVEHTAARTALQNNIDDITLQLSAQETSYLSDMQKLTPEYATAEGYVVPATVTPVFASNDGNPLSFK